MTTQLTGSHHITYKAIFQHPVARNLDWRDIRSMLVVIADEVHEHGGSFKITRNGHTLVLHPPLRKTFSDIQELMNLRHFLDQSGGSLPRAAAPGTHLLVVIDHREACVYQTEMHGQVPQRIVPYDPQNAGRHLHYVGDDSNGQRRPERKSFYEAVVRRLQNAEQILLFGSGTGASSAMEQLVADLERNHPELAKRVVGSIVLDQQHLTEDQILAKAREFYATAPRPSAGNASGHATGEQAR